jgi:hypothetical protein
LFAISIKNDDLIEEAKEIKKKKRREEKRREEIYNKIIL